RLMKRAPDDRTADNLPLRHRSAPSVMDLDLLEAHARPPRKLAGRHYAAAHDRRSNLRRAAGQRYDTATGNDSDTLSRRRIRIAVWCRKRPSSRNSHVAGAASGGNAT